YSTTPVSNLRASITVAWDNYTNQLITRDGRGLRIKEIANYTDDANLATKEEYTYDPAITLTPATNITKTSQDVKYRLGYTDGSISSFCLYYESPMCRVYSSSSIYPLTTCIGSPMLYPKVVKRVVDSQGADLGKSEYAYDIFQNDNDPITGPYITVPLIANDWENGFLKSETHYKITNSVYSKVKESVNEYAKLKLSEAHSLRISPYFIHVGCMFQGPSFIHSDVDFATIPIRGGAKLLTKTTNVVYDDNQQALTTVIEHEYGNTENILETKTTMTDSKHHSRFIYLKYPLDFSSPGNVYEKMVQQNIVAPIIQQQSFDGSTLLSTIKNNYKDWKQDGKVIQPETIQGAVYANALEDRVKMFDYDDQSNLLSASKADDVTTSYIWNLNKTLPVASVTNAQAGEIFFESFEDAGTWNGLVTLDIGNPHTGMYAARIDNAGPGEYFCQSKKWLSVALIASTKFRFSGWVYSNGPSADLYLLMKRAGETGTATYTDFVSTSVTGKWVFIEKEFTVPADVTQMSVRIDNNGTGIAWFDDIRVAPSKSMMTTYTYEPMIGMTSQSDANNRVVFYEYDAMGRLMLIRDQDRNIIKKYCYNYAGQQEDCTVYANTLRTGSYNRNDCGFGMVGSSVVYTVPAGRYTASSALLADQMALDEISANGQVYANQHGTCNAQPAQFAACCGWGSPFSNFNFNGTTSVSFQLTIASTGGSPIWTNTNKIGNIGGSYYRPFSNVTVNVSEGVRQWALTIVQNGDVYIQLISGTPPPGSNSVSFSGTYTL
ncbi:MAG TPA: DUF5977 domain-containing protein, partial [Chryseolinea sp.]|nr:DUF5977 domain-containing protein [Chryseolinea sp.]